MAWMYVAPMGFVLLSLVASGIAQCTAAARVGSASTAPATVAPVDTAPPPPTVAAPASAPAPPPSRPPPRDLPLADAPNSLASGAEGTLRKPIVDAIVRAHKDALRACFRNSNGMSSYRIEISEDGHARFLHEPTTQSAVCVSSEVSRWRFPSAKATTRFSLDCQYVSDASVTTATNFR
jgi:hypothetical protein